MAEKQSSKGKSEEGGVRGLVGRLTDTVKRAVGYDQDAPERAAPNPDPLFRVLHAEHEEVSQLFEKLLATDDVQQARMLWTRVSVALLTHARAEQETVYDRMSDDPGLVEDADHGVEEHGEIEALLLETNELEPGTAPFRAKVAELDRNVRHHVRDEEEELLPKTAEVLSLEERAQLVVRFRERSDAVEPRVVLELTGREAGREAGNRLPTRKSALASLPDLIDADDAEDATVEAVGTGDAESTSDAGKGKGKSKSKGGSQTKSAGTQTPGTRRARAAGSKDLDDHSVKELQELARARGIEGRSRMRKEDLIAALSKA